MVLEPLCVLADEFRPLRSLRILEVHESFPCRLASERVGVVLDESVHEVNCSKCVIHPHHVKVIPCLEVTCVVIFDEQSDILLLSVILSDGGGLLKFDAYLLEGRTVESPYLRHFFIDLSVSALHHLGVQTI